MEDSVITKTYHPAEPDRSPEEAKRKLANIDERFVAQMRLYHPELEGIVPTIAGDSVPRTFHRRVEVRSRGIV